MQVDYSDAAKGHWEDAAYLWEASRLANADHLFGLSAECSLKAVMISLGMGLGKDDAPRERRHRVHINNLWTEFITFAQSRNGAHYVALMSGMVDPFADWHVNQRYWQRSYITKQVAESHRQAAHIARQVLGAAISAGGVT